MTKSRRASHASSSSRKSTSTGNSSSTNTSVSKKEPTIVIPEKIVEDEEDYNSGFASYLRSPEGVDMMKLFVVANSIVVILTMAWPSVREFYKMIQELIFEEEVF